MTGVQTCALPISNQNTDAFYFWFDGIVEVVSQGNKIADDHVHLTHGPNGTIIAAIKTGVDNTIGTFVRDKGWSPFYKIASDATRPIVIFEGQEVFYFYTKMSTKQIFMKSISFDFIPFIERAEPFLIMPGNDATSTKQNICCMVASKNSDARIYYEEVF